MLKNHITSTIPQAHTTDQSLLTTISISFDANIRVVRTLDLINVQLVDETELPSGQVRINEDPIDVDGVIAYNNSTRVSTFTPSKALLPQKKYRVSVNCNSLQNSNNTLMGDFDFSFKTGDGTPGITLFIKKNGDRNKVFNFFYLNFLIIF